MKKLYGIAILFCLILNACSPYMQAQEFNSVQPAKQPTAFEPIKIYKHCPDHVICYVKINKDDNNERGYGGTWCTRDADLVEKYCDEEELT